MTDVKNDSLDNVFDFRDKEINAEEIMAKLRERIAARRAQAAAQGLAYDDLASTAKAQPLLDVSTPHKVSPELAAQVAALNQNADDIFVPLSVVGMPNPITKRVRMALHQLVIYYVNMLAGKQAAVNRANAQIVSGLLAALGDAHKRIDALEQELRNKK